MPAPKRKPLGDGSTYADEVMRAWDRLPAEMFEESDPAQEAAPDGRDDMALPAGRVCCDCAHWPRCKALIQSLCPAGTRCDFAPSRYREKTNV